MQPVPDRSAPPRAQSPARLARFHGLLRQVAAPALLASLILCGSGCRRSDNAPLPTSPDGQAPSAASARAMKDLGWLEFAPYDNGVERHEWFTAFNRERAREFFVPQLQRALVRAAADPAQLKQSLAQQETWLTEIAGTLENPLADANQRLQQSLHQSTTASGIPAAPTPLRQILERDAAELGWAPERIDNPVAALREATSGLALLLDQLDAAPSTAVAIAAAAEPPSPAPEAPTGTATSAPLTTAPPAANTTLAPLLDQLNQRCAEYPLPEMFSRRSLTELPQELQDPQGWTTNWDEPEIGSDEARKGGLYREYIPTFPATLRRIGPNSNSSFRGYHYDRIELACISIHPNTGAIIPMLCDRWFTTADTRTVFFHIDERATWSDGLPINTEDILTTVFLSASPTGQEPFGAQYYREQFVNYTIYDDHTFSVTMRTPKPIELAPYFASHIASQTRFFSEAGPDFPERYQWRPCPTAGAYIIQPEDIILNQSIGMTRVQNWWRRDIKYTKNCYNPDRMEFRVVRDPNRAWELFRAGEFESFMITLPEFWDDKSEMPAVFEGYVERAVFYNVFPRPPWGLYLNTARPPLDDRNVRLGVAYACDWTQVIQQDFRGAARRLPCFSVGYPLLPDSQIEALEFDPAKARELFARAGYTQRGNDGILRSAQGKRLSLTISLPADPVRMRMLRRLVAGAARAGLELILNAQDPTANYREVQEKKFEMAYTAWSFDPPTPDSFQFLHSSMAREADGTLKPMTNNIFSWAAPESDRLVERERAASTLAERIEMNDAINHYIHDQGLFIPGHMLDFSRVAYWRWMRWPDDFSVRSAYIPPESFVWWIDEDRRRETLEARAEGKTFPEVLRIHDQYRRN